MRKLATKFTTVLGVNGKHINIKIGTSPCLSIKCKFFHTFFALTLCIKDESTNFLKIKYSKCPSDDP